MLNQRLSGILCPIFSLPNQEGIGTFGKSAYRFIDFLIATKQSYWQILPIGITSFGDSPYQSFSSYAGNPYFIDLQILVDEGLLSQDDYTSVDWGNKSYVDYSILWNKKYQLLYKAFKKAKLSEQMYQEAYHQYPWLEDFSVFMALKAHFGGISRIEWPEVIKKTLPSALKSELQDQVQFHVFLQCIFYKQWSQLKKYANDHHIRIIGDLPIFVSEDSADVWSNPEFFQLDSSGFSTEVAGVPPDYFSDTGQLWGNPLYDWDRLEKDHFSWWIHRIQASFQLFDILRIDHFRGFESYWSVKSGSPHAIGGKWVKAPGKLFFDILKKEIKNLDIIAEDLGIITDDVRELMSYVGFPGMKVLHFAFDDEPSNPYKPENISKNSVVYTGTHDNDTTVGWFLDPKNHHYVANALKYMNLSYTTADDFAYRLIEMSFSTNANTVIIPIQDILLKGSEARINTPSTVEGNWSWRMTSFPNDFMQEWLISMTNQYNRVSVKSSCN